MTARFTDSYPYYLHQHKNYLFVKTRAIFGDERAQYFSGNSRLFFRGPSGTVYQFIFAPTGYRVAAASNTADVLSHQPGPQRKNEIVELFSFCMQPDIPPSDPLYQRVGIRQYDDQSRFSRIKLDLVQLMTYYLMIRANESKFLHTANYFHEGTSMLYNFLEGNQVFE